MDKENMVYPTVEKNVYVTNEVLKYAPAWMKLENSVQRKKSLTNDRILYDFI